MAVTVFDTLHLTGVTMIQSLQSSMKSYTDLMLFCSHLGDPRNAFLVYFPVAFTISRNVGIQVMWVGALAEWLNALLKWLLFGHRPYWWINETPLYKTPPHLEQYPLTCETGPGSPSGHAMVTASVWYVMITAVIQGSKQSQHKSGWWLPLGCWLLFLLFLLPVNLARLFLATHFPHQVVFGTLVGILLAVICGQLNLQKSSLKFYTVGSLVLLLSGPAVYRAVEAIGLDPLWTMTLAKKWCAKQEWVHLDTTLFFALTRDASSLLGTGVALHRLDKSVLADQEQTTVLAKIITIILSIMLTRGQEVFVVIPQHDPITFYSLAYLKYFLLPYLVIIYIPKLVSLICASRKTLKNS